ncbi:MAG: hypothetical protein MJZ61_09210 [Bacteroidales bacterium]|nr:hypothetical protein [Bacteroidales bacterium]
MKKLFAALIAVLLSGLINLAQAQNESNYLCFKAVGGDASFGIENNGVYDYPEIEFSYDRNNWEPMESGVYYSLNNSQKVYLRGENRKISHDYYGDQYTRFIMTGQIAASGSVMSLLDNGTGTLNEVSERDCFTKLFLDCTSLTQAPELPAMSVSENGYHNMFNGCTSLTKAPEIPATDMNLLSCEAMFANCTSLVEGPSVLYASAPFCYEGMFSGCINLTKAPKLPNQWVSWGCCNAMFAGCTSLETAPELPAEYLADQCYSCMFNGCSSLKYVKVHFTDWNDANYSTKDYYYDSDKAGKGGCITLHLKELSYVPKT